MSTLQAIISDLHCETTNASTMRTVARICKDLGVTEVVSLGDFISNEALTHWPAGTTERFTYGNMVKKANDALDHLEFAKKKFWLWGNHEVWAKEYVAQRQELEGAIDLRRDFALDKRGWSVVDEEHKPLVFPHALWHHGHATKSRPFQYYATEFWCTYATSRQRHVFVGHWHSSDEFSTPYVTVHGCGYLGAERPPYLKASTPKWNRGFRIVEYSGTYLTTTFIPLSYDDKALINGKLYRGQH